MSREIVQYEYCIDVFTQKPITIFSCEKNPFEKNGFAIARPNYTLLTPQVYPWDYLQNNHIWLNRGFQTALVYDTKEEAEFACTQHLNFLKECGYAI